MKLITDEGKELDISSLQPIVIGETQKVVVTLDRDERINIPVQILVETFNSFFGEGKWLLATGPIKLEVQNG